MPPIRPALFDELLKDYQKPEDVPRDCEVSFEPQLVKKGQTRFGGLDEKTISLYARGHDTAREPRPPRRALRRRDLTLNGHGPLG